LAKASMINLKFSAEDVACPVNDMRKWIVHRDILSFGGME
jgi:hypothetical protein